MKIELLLMPRKPDKNNTKPHIKNAKLSVMQPTETSQEQKDIKLKHSMMLIKLTVKLTKPEDRKRKQAIKAPELTAKVLREVPNN
jgi:hypothetical protein